MTCISTNQTQFALNFATSWKLVLGVRTQLSIKSKEDNSGTSYMKFSLKNTIKVTNSHFLYNGLTLMAEIGGYVGLFLGISVVHVNDMVRNVLERISWE